LDFLKINAEAGIACLHEKFVTRVGRTQRLLRSQAPDAQKVNIKIIAKPENKRTLPRGCLWNETGNKWVEETGVRKGQKSTKRIYNLRETNCELLLNTSVGVWLGEG
jgi:hypothetical protein